MALAAYVLIGDWQSKNACTTALFHGCYAVRDPLDAAAVAGACVGFLWRNAPPAKIFMGDTGDRDRDLPGLLPPERHRGRGQGHARRGLDLARSPAPGPRRQVRDEALEVPGRVGA